MTDAPEPDGEPTEEEPGEAPAEEPDGEPTATESEDEWTDVDDATGERLDDEEQT